MPPDTQAIWRRRTLVLAAFALTFGLAYVWLGTREDAGQSSADPPPDEPLTDAERSALVETVRSGQRVLEHPTLRLLFAYPEGFRLGWSGPPERKPDASATARKAAQYLQMYELDEDA